VSDHARRVIGMVDAGLGFVDGDDIPADDGFDNAALSASLKVFQHLIPSRC